MSSVAGAPPLPVGTEVGLLSSGRSPTPSNVVARVIDWQSSTDGDSLTLDVTAGSAVGWLFAGDSVWVSGRTPSGELVVLEAAPASDPAGPLRLLGVTTLAREPRRDAVRAEVRAPVTLSRVADATEGTELEGVTVDLSRSGCRLRLHHGVAPPVGHRLDVTMDFDGEAVRAVATVTRADGPELCLALASLEPADALLVEKAVFGALGNPAG
jgi:hypothetical protein